MYNNPLQLIPSMFFLAAPSFLQLIMDEVVCEVELLGVID
jgi:hypothetical protein